jgi:hypothetical protein
MLAFSLRRFSGSGGPRAGIWRHRNPLKLVGLIWLKEDRYLTPSAEVLDLHKLQREEALQTGNRHGTGVLVCRRD